MSYTIKSINTNGSVDVSFSIDKKIQNLSGKNVENAEALKAELTEYEAAYVAGIEAAAASIPQEVKDLVGETITTE